MLLRWRRRIRWGSNGAAYARGRAPQASHPMQTRRRAIAPAKAIAGSGHRIATETGRRAERSAVLLAAGELPRAPQPLKTVQQVSPMVDDRHRRAAAPLGPPPPPAAAASTLGCLPACMSTRDRLFAPCRLTTSFTSTMASDRQAVPLVRVPRCTLSLAAAAPPTASCCAQRHADAALSFRQPLCAVPAPQGGAVFRS